MVQQFQQAEQPRRRTRVRAEHRYPVYDLDSAIGLVRAIRDNGGGQADHPHLASFLNYSSTNNGAFLHRVASAGLFGLTEKSGKYLVPTLLANRILAPEHPGEDDVRARFEAFMNVPLYRQLFERYRTGQLPPEMGLRNMLETVYGVPRIRAQIAYRVFMGSAEQAGLFDARGGVRTHLVAPVIPGREDRTDEEWAQTLVSPTDPLAPHRGELTQELPRLQTAADPIRQLRQMLVQKVKEVPATDLETIREYIKEIKELAALEEHRPEQGEQ